MARVRTQKVKWCWVATETRKGWRLKLSCGSRDYNLSGLLIADANNIGEITRDGPTVYVHLKDGKRRG